MAAADAAGIAGAAIGGATPFGWAQLALGGLGAAGSIAKPAGPSSADAVFGSSMFSVDSSGWMVNVGGTQGQTTGDRGGNTQIPTQTQTNPKTQTAAAPSQGGGYAAPYQQPYGQSYPAAPAGIGGISPLVLIIGALVLVKVARK